METKRGKVSNKKYRAARPRPRTPLAGAGRLPRCLAPPESPRPAWPSGRRGRTFASANRLSHASAS
eukprot:13077323-Heterocapsa_arctica.AAC.1